MIPDPRWPAALADARHHAGLTLRQLAARVHYSRSYLHGLETGQRRTSPDIAGRLDDVLGTGGTLTRMLTTPTPGLTPDDEARLAYVAAHPTRLDADAVRLLTRALAAARRLDDTTAARVMLPWAVPQWRTVHTLARQARGPHAPELHPIAAEWTQFIGWLYAEDRRSSEAVRFLVEAADQAEAVGSGVLAAQASNFQGYVARHRDQPLGIVRHFLTAYHTPGAATLQRVGDAAQAAHGLALLGDQAAARRLLGEASDLVEAADGETAPETAYWLTPEFCRLNIGLAYRGLGDQATAADHLRAGLDSLPADQADAEWTTEYRQALAATGR